MKFLKDVDFKNKRVLLRAGFNVPIENGIIKDDWRIRATLPTIKYILKQPKSKLVIISHLGRPDGKANPDYSLRVVADRLSELLGKEVKFIEDILSPEGDNIIQSLGEGEIALVENIRFYPEEEQGNEQFAIEISHHFGVFVNDAFCDSHRAHASISVIPKFKPSCAGLIMEKEIGELTKALNPPKRPSLAIIGGIKIETKLPVIEELAKVYDIILVGGKIGIEAQEKNIKLQENVILPEDYVDGKDIGPKTAEKYAKVIEAAAFAVWNGALGKFEEVEYAAGTMAVFNALCKADSYKIAGGGETVEIIQNYKKNDCFDFISSGGGAMLEFLAGEKLPGIIALEENA
ncbi:MAG: phosphoglycerate kinase [Parcubacteria group bacterium]|jgi:phosphoglycerate kinase